jgi:hypothetical protein
MDAERLNPVETPLPVTRAERTGLLRAALGLPVEYAMFASAVFLALFLFATRVPLRLVDRTFGIRLRERFVDLLARISPG